MRLAIGGLCLVAASTASAADWRVAGMTYNSVAFVDVASIRASGAGKAFTAMRVSGQPAKDGWSHVMQKLTAICGTGIFLDAGSVITQADGSVKRYPGSGASQKAVSSGVFHDMFDIVCGGRKAKSVADPKAWTRANFKVGS